MKNRDQEIGKWIEQEIDQACKYIKFNTSSKEKVINKIMMEEKHVWLYKMLNYEIKVPLTPIVAMGIAIFVGIGYMTYPVIKVDEQDIMTSQIKVIDLAERR